MTRELLTEWLDESPVHARAFLEEGLDATEAICTAMEKRRMKAALASRLGTSNLYGNGKTPHVQGSSSEPSRNQQGVRHSIAEGQQEHDPPDIRQYCVCVEHDAGDGVEGRRCKF